MSVDHRRNSWRRVPQDLRDGDEWHATGQHERCGSVTEVVKADLRQFQGLEHAFEVLHQVRAMNRCPGLSHEHQIELVLPLAAKKLTLLGVVAVMLPEYF